MTIDYFTNELSLLSMDAYNEGFFPGIKLPDTIGDSEFRPEIYNYIIMLDDVGITDKQRSDWKKIGFSATVYMSGGKYIISYRGTDDPAALSGSGASDVWNGYGLGRGGTSAPEALAAIDLYKAVRAYAVQNDGDEKDIILTGHSMGGGFAGYVAELFGVDATIFDPMPFVDGATNTYARATAETVTATG